MISLTNLTMRAPARHGMNFVATWCLQKRLLRTIGTIISATTLLTSQSLWLFDKPALADQANICGVPGQDGVGNLNGIVNSYYPGGINGTVAVGATSIPVGSINTAGSATPIKKGDLLLIIQMQDADINSTDTDAYGNGTGGDVPTNVATVPSPTGASGVTNLNNAGRYEYVVASSSVSGGSVPIISGTKYSYRNTTGTATTAKRTYQVIRVPQYSTATVTGTLTTSARWDGASGGIVVVDVAQQLNFAAGSVIDVNGLGFRGGGSNPNPYSGGSTSPSPFRSTSAGPGAGDNAPKGEGIAGTPRLVATQPFGSFNVRSATVTTDLNGTNYGYPNGDEGRGAPGNAGGGGNEHNSGGGGGANGGDGGIGGRAFDGFGGSPPQYDGYVGGFGGKAISPDPLRLFLGGGGGAGDTNDQQKPSGAGGGGGGIVIVRAGNITGSGTINTRGADGIDSPQGFNPDAGGGGGAGGTVLITTTTGNASGVTINAQGGDGGDLNENNTKELDGPGGGGGGGIAYTNGGATFSPTPGKAGLVTNNTTSRNNTSNGATAGTSGTGAPVIISTADISSTISGSSCLVQVAKTTSTPISLAPGTATYTITASNPAGSNRAGAEQVVISDDLLPSGFTHTAAAITPVYTGGATGPATVTSTGTATKPSWSGFKIPPGGNVSITFTVNIATGTATGTYNNSATATGKYYNTSANVPTATGQTVDSNYNGTIATNTGEDVTILPPSTLTADKTVLLVVDSDKSGGTTPLASQTATPGDILEYTVVVKNTSTTTARNNVILKDIIPTNTTYVGSTLQIDGTGKSDGADTDQADFTTPQVIFRLGTGANGTTGGTLAANATSTIKFRVKINDPVTNGVTAVSNQAVVSSNGVGDVNSNDPGTPTANDPTVSKIAPRLRLVKRVTGIRKSGSSSTTAIAGYNDLATDVNDDPSVNWAGGSSNYLLGAITTQQIPTPIPGLPAPKDEVEYTIYFLSDSAIAARDVNICDFVPANQTFVSGSMQLNFNGTTTNIADGSGTGSGSGFYTSSFPASCYGTNNNKGAVSIQIGDVISVISNPSSSYGYIRFRAKVN
jgi:uncharacterized repeat protein (TIGR01451 family)